MNEAKSVNSTYIGNTPNRSSMTMTINEPPMGDSSEYVEAFPAATGMEIRNMMKTNGITILRAAQIFQITQKNVRGRRRLGANKGLHSWEWMRWLPYRFKTLERLTTSSNWLPFEARREVKLFQVEHYRTSYECMGVKLSPDDAGVEWEESFIRKTARISNSPGADIFFGRIDLPCKKHGEAVTLPVITRDPLDHVRAYGSMDLMLAHLHVQEHWDAIKSGSVLDGVSLSAAYDGPRLCRADILAEDLSDRLRVAS